MHWKRASLAVLAAAGAMLAAGCGGGDNFVRDINQPVAVVAAAIEDLDVRRLPHTRAEVGKDAHLPEIRALRTADGFTWSVMSGEEAVLVMSATLEPINGGAATRVKGRVAKGEASQAEAVLPLFRDPAAMGRLFAVGLERELGDYIPRSERSLFSLAERPYGSAAGQRNEALAQGFATVVAVHRGGGEIGEGPGDFRPPVSKMGEARTGGDPNVSFKAGKPMVDAKR
jgi:hypothetical protein